MRPVLPDRCGALLCLAGRLGLDGLGFDLRCDLRCRRRTAGLAFLGLDLVDFVACGVSGKDVPRPRRQHLLFDAVVRHDEEFPVQGDGLHDLVVRQACQILAVLRHLEINVSGLSDDQLLLRKVRRAGLGRSHSRRLRHACTGASTDLSATGQRLFLTARLRKLPINALESFVLGRVVETILCDGGIDFRLGALPQSGVVLLLLGQCALTLDLRGALPLLCFALLLDRLSLPAGDQVGWVAHGAPNQIVFLLLKPLFLRANIGTRRTVPVANDLQISKITTLLLQLLQLFGRLATCINKHLPDALTLSRRDVRHVLVAGHAGRHRQRLALRTHGILHIGHLRTGGADDHGTVLPAADDLAGLVLRLALRTAPLILRYSRKAGTLPVEELLLISKSPTRIAACLLICLWTGSSGICTHSGNLCCFRIRRQSIELTLQSCLLCRILFHQYALGKVWLVLDALRCRARCLHRRRRTFEATALCKPALSAGCHGWRGSRHGHHATVLERGAFPADRAPWAGTRRPHLLRSRPHGLPAVGLLLFRRNAALAHLRVRVGTESRRRLPATHALFFEGRGRLRAGGCAELALFEWVRLAHCLPSARMGRSCSATSGVPCTRRMA